MRVNSLGLSRGPFANWQGANVTPDELERWQTKQIQAAIAFGINPIDAAKAVDEFLANVPSGADPRTYVRPAYQLEQDISSQAVEDDARAAWFGDTDPRYARLLDAKEVE